jgi:hypothetical protein
MKTLIVGAAVFFCTIAQGQTIQSMEAEARRLVQQYWDRVLTKCGDSYYYTAMGAGELAGGAVFQIKGDVSFRLARSPHQLSPADKANGLEWEGTSLMTPIGLTRQAAFYTASGGLVLQAWEEWKDAPSRELLERLELRRVRGAWSVQHQEGGRAFSGIFDRKLSCEVITRPLPSPPVESREGDIVPGRPQDEVNPWSETRS